MERSPPQVHWILWASMTLSSVVFIGVLLFLLSTDAIGETPPELPLVAFLFGGSAVAATGSLLVGRLFLRDLPPPTRFIVRWALGEACAIFGFVNGFLGGPLLLAGAQMLAGVVLVVGQPPLQTPDDQRREEARSASG